MKSSEELSAALQNLVDEVQEWVDAVSKDSSWDGWDHCYKNLKWKSLPKYKELLKGELEKIK